MIRLALPVILTYLGFMAMGTVDIYFVGRLSPVAIGAVGVGTSIFAWFMVFGTGLLGGLDYLVSYAFGAKQPERAFDALVQSLIAMAALTPPLMVGAWVLSAHLHWFGVNAEVAPLAADYLRILAWSLPLVFFFNAIRQYLTAQNVAVPGMVILLIANLVNALGNWLWVEGHAGFAARGVAGSADATVWARALSLLLLAAYLVYHDARHARCLRTRRWRLHRELMRDFLRLGGPSALQMTFEVGVFGLCTTLAARFRPADLAAHQIVLHIASVAFMVPLGIGVATAVLVGQALGEQNPRLARTRGWQGLQLGFGFAAISSLALLVFPRALIGFFTDSAEVIELARQILWIATVFQIADGVQVILAGALRGWADTRSAMIANLAGHWGVGLPLGLLAGFYWGWGVFGIWIGLSTGLFVVAGSLLARWLWITRHLRKPLPA